MAQRKQTWLVSMRMWVRSLASFSRLRIWCCVAVSCGVGRRCGLGPVLLWLWRRPAAAAPIQRLAQELPYAAGATIKRKEKRTPTAAAQVPVEVQFWPQPAQWIKGSGVALSCGVGHRRGSDPVLLWLWCRPAAVALILPLAWKFPYAVGMDLPKKGQKNLIYILSILSKWLY